MKRIASWASVLASVVLAVPAAADPHAVDAEQIRAAIADAVRTVAPAGTSVEMQQAPILLTGDDGGTVALDVALPDGPLLAGVRAVPVTCRVGGRVVSRGLATLAIRRTVGVWVVAREIAAGTTLTPEDVRHETRAFDREPGRELLDGFEPTRFTARHPLVEGAVLKSTDLVRRPDVMAGAPIALVVRAGAATVTLAATARRSGSVGETILVANPLTSGVVQAVVTGTGMAELVRAVAPRRPVRSSSQGEAK